MQQFRQRLPQADPEIVSGVALQSPLARALSDALDSLVKEDTKSNDGIPGAEDAVSEEDIVDGERVGGREKPDCVTNFQTGMSDSILTAYSNAVVRTDFSKAPAAILRGRMDHYNRVDHRWRIAVEDAELRRRASHTKPSHRRKGRISLWEASEKEHPNAKRLKVDGTLHILAYGDS
uniref:Uncharacterized protein n=1 Tax=Grammatophora oceanica TaxID=210454 RepID=A0A7S1Y2K2_9STRA|mmetsp:Transcript_14268/g.20921  ORF Transcript_14268/g.20921 Transcript_14268/m.20921 type:complete len:177 (+) Transcript_14268:90-620(+)